MYRLSVSMDTDDDAELMYEGKFYCFYGPNLVFNKTFDHRYQAADHLLTQVRVLVGGKMDTATHKWLHSAWGLLTEGHEAVYLGGNQTYDVTLVEIKEKEDG